MTPILLDTAVAIILILSIIVAFYRGFVKEMLTIINLVGSASAAWFLGPLMSPTFQKWMGAPEKSGDKADLIFGMIPPEVMGTFLAYASAFFGTFIILMLAGMAISGSVKALGLGPIDKFLGMAFGALRGFLLVFLVYLPFANLAPPDKHDYPKWITGSVTFVALDATYQWVDEYMGSDDKDLDKENIEKESSVLKTKLKKMGDDLMQEKEQMQDSAADKIDETRRNAEDIKTELYDDILTDEERQRR